VGRAIGVQTFKHGCCSSTLRSMPQATTIGDFFGTLKSSARFASAKPVPRDA
jgi:hypothetical protein